jgi:N-acetylneuraminate synthase
MMTWLCEHFAGGLHVSLGMTTHAEERVLLDLLDAHGRLQDTVIYACTSGYPVAVDDLCLREITRLVDAYGAKVQAIGFSGHHLGIAADIAAITLGAAWLERHFTLDRTSKGTDHAASLEPDGMRRLCRDVRNVARALTFRDSEILEVERPQRTKLKTPNKPRLVRAA